jgi:hypothetical protein
LFGKDYRQETVVVGDKNEAEIFIAKVLKASEDYHV